MIIKFDNFLNEKTEFATPLYYDEALQILNSSRPIKDHIKNHYSDEKVNFLGEYNRTMSTRKIIDALKFAKKENDTVLIDLINNHLTMIEELKIKKEAEKYNL